ncbi:unknown [Bacteroides sp. CAG:530]|nr:unknown [Bacteroides sp. CAG:530]
MMPFTALRKMSFELKLSFDANGSVWSNWYFVDSETGKRYSLTENITL